jgi:hypothetical protein
MTTSKATDIKSVNATQCGDRTNEFTIRYDVQKGENDVEVHGMNITSAVRFCTGEERPNNFSATEEQQHHRVVVAGKFISTTPEDNATLSTWPAEVQKQIQDKLTANPPGTWGYFIAKFSAGGFSFGPDEFQEFSKPGLDDPTTCYGREYAHFATIRIPSAAFPPILTDDPDCDQSDLCKAEFLVVQYVEDLGIPKITGLKVDTHSGRGVRTDSRIENNIGMCPSEKLLTEDYLKFNGVVDEKDIYDLLFDAGIAVDLESDTVFMPPHAQVKALTAASTSPNDLLNYAKYHVINQDVTAAQLKTGQSFATMLSLAPLSFDSGNASLLVEEVVTKNGRIHKTSEVLTPPGLRQVVTNAPTPFSSAPSVSSPAVLVPLLVVARLFF